MRALIGILIAFSISSLLLIGLRLLLKPVKADTSGQTISPAVWGADRFPNQTITFVASYPGQGGLGKALAFGDINGDGFEDLLIGDRFLSAEVQAQGEVYLYLGPLTFGQTITVPDRAAIVFRGTGIYQPQLGIHLSTADFNNDGYDDVILGGMTTSFVYLGSPHITSTAAFSLEVTAADVALTIFSNDRGPAACDFNGDHYEDLFVQTPSRVWGVLGNSQLSLTAPITISFQPTQPDITITGFQPDEWSSFGKSDIKCGDIDGDGFKDLIIGVPGDSPGGRHLAGSVYVVKGTSAITYHQPITIQVPDQIDAIIEGIDTITRTGDHLGRDLAVADTNNDGRDDLVMGAAYAAGPDNVDDIIGYFPGETYLWLGQALNGQVVDLNNQAEWTIFGDNPLASLGQAIDTGDIDGDGNIEVILGCAGCNGQGLPTDGAGAVFVIEPESIYGTQPITSAARFRVEGRDIGVAVAVGNLDADAYDDIVFSASGNDAASTPAKVFVLSYPFRQRGYLPFVVKN